MSIVTLPNTPNVVTPPVRAHSVTAEEMLDNDLYKSAELVYGQVREKAVSKESSRITITIVLLLGAWLKRTKAGELYSPELGYKCFPDDPGGFRKADVSFVTAERVKTIVGDPGYMPIRPDLAVEVISPGDRAGEIREKTAEYKSIDIPLIWTVFPRTKEVIVSRPGLPDVTLGVNDTLDGGDVLTGFSCKVSELFE